MFPSRQQLLRERSVRQTRDCFVAPKASNMMTLEHLAQVLTEHSRRRTSADLKDAADKFNTEKMTRKFIADSSKNYCNLQFDEFHRKVALFYTMRAI